MALTQVIMPKTGAEMEEGKIVSWKKQPGERISAGEILLEIETDKATMEVESPASGVLLRTLFAPEAMVTATHLIAVIGDGTESAEQIDGFIKSTSGPGAGEPVPAAATAPAPPQPAAAPTAGPKGIDQRVKASPLARRLAQEKGIDLAAIKGTGPDGRIEKEDVLRAATVPQAVPAPAPASGELISLSPMRRAISRTVQRSKKEIPEFSVTMQMEMAAALRKKNALKAEGASVSLNDLIIFATARALSSHPDLNSLLEGDTLRRRPINIGFALGTDDGLYLPVVRRPDRLTVEEIATITTQYAAKAEKKQITEEDMTGGTFTISNLGMFGVESFTAIIAPSQSAILSVGAVVDQPQRGASGELTWQQIMAATLTLDHRVADGLGAARFLRDLKAQFNAL